MSTPANDQSVNLMVTPTRLAFTRGSWSIPQAVTVRAPEDDDGNGTTPAAPVVLTHDVIGGGYDDQPARDVSVTVRDNDTPGLLVTPDGSANSRRFIPGIYGSAQNKTDGASDGGGGCSQQRPRPSPSSLT